jgi:hypothetical protein
MTLATNGDVARVAHAVLPQCGVFAKGKKKKEKKNGEKNNTYNSTLRLPELCALISSKTT